MLQPELFQDLQSEQKSKQFEFSPFAGRFLRVKVAYEDAVFTVLGALLVILAGFCLGVERGKQLGPQPQIIKTVGIATARESTPVAVAAAVPPVRPAVAARKPIPVIRAAAVPVAVAAPVAETGPKAVGDFAIQLATYVGPEAAQQEVRRLAKKGIQSQVLKQGKYLELRAVGYRTKAEAKAAVATLRKMYPDAFLKRVSTQTN